MKISDFLNMKIERLNQKEMNRISGFIQSQANRGLTNWENKDYRSPAYYGAQKSGGRFDIKNAGTLNQQKKELARALRFLRDPTRTAAGFKESQGTTIEALKEKGVDLSADQYNDFWEGYEKAKELNPTVAEAEYKYLAMETIDLYLDAGLDADEAAVDLSEYLDWMEGQQSEVEENAIDGVSRFFKKEENL